MMEIEILDETFFIMSRTEYISNNMVIVLGVLFCISFLGWLVYWSWQTIKQKNEYMSKLSDKEYRHCDKVRRM